MKDKGVLVLHVGVIDSKGIYKHDPKLDKEFKNSDDLKKNGKEYA